MNAQGRGAPQVIVFDLDGTLVDSAPDLLASINRVLGTSGRRNLELAEVTGMVGDGVPKLVERALVATGGVPDGESVENLAGWVSRYLDDYQSHHTELTRPYPGVPETLESLRATGFQLAVCTNKPHQATMAILETLGLAGMFNAVLGGDVLDGVRKPDPRHLMAVLSGLGVAPDAAVMVGDHLNDLACARGAGSSAVLCAYGYSRTPVDELGADAVIERFDELPKAIEGLA